MGAMKKRARRRLVGGVVAAACVMTLVACGDDDSGSDASGTTTGDAATTAAGAATTGAATTAAGEQATGEPIVIGIYTPADNQSFTAPELIDGAEAAVEYVNNQLGGIGGRPIQLESCTTDYTAPGLTACVNELFQKETGQPMDKIERDMHRDFWMSAEEAVAYGLVHKIVHNTRELAT